MAFAIFYSGCWSSRRCSYNKRRAWCMRKCSSYFMWIHNNPKILNRALLLLLGCFLINSMNRQGHEDIEMHCSTSSKDFDKHTNWSMASKIPEVVWLLLVMDYAHLQKFHVHITLLTKASLRVGLLPYYSFKQCKELTLPLSKGLIAEKLLHRQRSNVIMWPALW